MFETYRPNMSAPGTAGSLGTVTQAIDLIRRKDLLYPGEELLECFVQESKDCHKAAAFVLEKSVVERGLESLLTDWKQLLNTFADHTPQLSHPDKTTFSKIVSRDQNRCRITGLGPSLFDPLVVAPTFLWAKINIDEPLHEVLRAFVGPDAFQRLIDRTHSPIETDQAYWLVRKSSLSAQSQGFFQFELNPIRTQRITYSVATAIIGSVPSIVKHLPLLRLDEFPAIGPAPDFSGLQITSRFAKPLRWILVAREIDKKKELVRVSAGCSTLAWVHRNCWDTATRFILNIWQLAPGSIRVRAYLSLAFVGLRLYGKTSSQHVLRLPFGLYLKSADKPHHQGLANEHGALKLIRKHTNVPVPRALDLLSTSDTTYLLTSTLPGGRLGAEIDTLTHKEADQLILDLQKCLEELKSIPKSIAPEYAITNAIGGQLYDYRINAALEADEDNYGFVGPFHNEDRFNEKLEVGALPGIFHKSGHHIVFTHGDLNLRNILTSNGRLSGLVDWENSGWYPEYWDYTKALYVTKRHRRWLRIVDEVFKGLGEYETERQTERQLWDYCF